MQTHRSIRSLVAASALAVGFVAVHADAGAQAAPRPTFGALLGANFYTLTDSDFSEFEEDVGAELKSSRRVGFQIGAYLQQPLSGAFSIQPELHYIQKGVNYELNVSDPNVDVSGDLTLRLSYLEVPVLLRYDADASRRVRPFVVAGPTFAYRVACKIGVEAEGFNQVADCDDTSDGEAVADDPNDPFKKFDVGALLGIGVQTTRGRRVMSAQLRYAQGFTTVARNATGDQSPKNSGISILLGIGF